MPGEERKAPEFLVIGVPVGLSDQCRGGMWRGRERKKSASWQDVPPQGAWGMWANNLEVFVFRGSFSYFG